MGSFLPIVLKLYRYNNGVLHAVNERVEHIQILIISTKEADNAIPTQDRYYGLSLNTIQVKSIKTSGNIII